MIDHENPEDSTCDLCEARVGTPALTELDVCEDCADLCEGRCVREPYEALPPDPVREAAERLARKYDSMDRWMWNCSDDHCCWDELCESCAAENEQFKPYLAAYRRAVAETEES